jgi:hypothetical protein
VDRGRKEPDADVNPRAEKPVPDRQNDPHRNPPATLPRQGTRTNLDFAIIATPEPGERATWSRKIPENRPGTPNAPAVYRDIALG